MKFILVVKLLEHAPKHLGPFETEAAAKDAMRRSVTYCNDEREIEWTKIETVVRPESVEELTYKLEKLLKNHDWTYPMSDDSRAYNRGLNQWREIVRIGQHVPTFDELFKKYKPA